MNLLRYWKKTKGCTFLSIYTVLARNLRIQSVMRPTFVPFLLWKVNRICSFHSSSSSLFSSSSNSLMIRTVVYAHSVYTSRMPGHALGPPPNGVYSHVGRTFFPSLGNKIFSVGTPEFRVAHHGSVVNLNQVALEDVEWVFSIRATTA